MTQRGSLISYFSRLATKQGGINLAQGIPGFSPTQALLDILTQKIQDNRLHQYPPGNGKFRLLELLSQTYSEFSIISPDNL